MIKKELNMLANGDMVEYVGKGDNQGFVGVVVNIDGKFITVTEYNGLPDRGLWGPSLTKSYKFWKFLSH